MYFCPCSCSKPDGEAEEDVLICLPRNLSYAGESYLDRYSVSSAFVHNPKKENQLLKADVEGHYLRAGASACEEFLLLEKEEQDKRQQQEEGDGDEEESQAMADDSSLREDTMVSRTAYNSGPDCCGDVSTSSSSHYVMTTQSTPMTIPPTLRPYLTVVDTGESDETGQGGQNGLEDRHGPLGQDRDSSTVESPDSDMVSEEGIFVNMMDDLEGEGAEGTNGKSTASEASDDTCVSEDSMYYSPEEVECIEDEEVRAERRQSLEEAVQQAAQNLSSDPPTEPENNESDKQQADDAQPAASTPAPVTSEPPKHPEVHRVTSKVSDLKITLTDTTLTKEERQRSLLDLVSPDSPLYEDREFHFTKAELRKSASLKSSKTPPGTPRRKKVVRFADAMGLDLESVRHILNLESPPKIPPSAMKDLEPGLSIDRREMGTKFLTPCFEQPGCDGNFIQRVLGEKLCLENAITVTGTTITGVVRVANISFHKNVRVRFTTNGWVTFHDIAASYVQNSNDGATDRFSFSIVAPQDFVPGSRLEFAVSFCANGQEFWDNNRGANYVFECFAKTIPTEMENAWMHFL